MPKFFRAHCYGYSIVKALNFKGFVRYRRCIFATTSMCIVLDRKNYLDGAEVYGKKTRYFAYFCANVYW